VLPRLVRERCGAGLCGMFNDSFSSPSLTNVTFAGNSADSGGGMFNYEASSPVLTNCTFEGNSATWGGAAHCSTLVTRRQC